MSVLTELERFHQFQQELLEQGRRELSPEEVLRLWREQRSEYVETVEAIREGLEDLQAGRVQPLGEFDEDFRTKHDVPHDA